MTHSHMHSCIAHFVFFYIIFKKKKEKENYFEVIQTVNIFSLLPWVNIKDAVHYTVFPQNPSHPPVVLQLKGL